MIPKNICKSILKKIGREIKTKTVKKISQNAACEQNNTSAKENKFLFKYDFLAHAAKPRVFSLHFLYQREQNHHF